MTLTTNYNTQQSNWIFHSSLFVLHLENAPLTTNYNTQQSNWIFHF